MSGSSECESSIRPGHDLDSEDSVPSSHAMACIRAAGQQKAPTPNTNSKDGQGLTRQDQKQLKHSDQVRAYSDSVALEGDIEDEDLPISKLNSKIQKLCGAHFKFCLKKYMKSSHISIISETLSTSSILIPMAMHLIASQVKFKFNLLSKVFANLHTQS